MPYGAAFCEPEFDRPPEQESTTRDNSLRLTCQAERAQQDAVSSSASWREGGRLPTMEAFIPWLTPALIVALAAWLRSDLRDTRQEIRDVRRELNSRFDSVNSRFDGVNDRIDGVSNDVNGRIDALATEMSKRFDGVSRELAEQRERMAKLEGSLEGFLAGRRDRDAA